MTHLWQRLAELGMLRDLTALAVAHVVAVPHVIAWAWRRRRRGRVAGKAAS